jgi:hypothetical protein
MASEPAAAHPRLEADILGATGAASASPPRESARCDIEMVTAIQSHVLSIGGYYDYRQEVARYCAERWPADTTNFNKKTFNSHARILKSSNARTLLLAILLASDELSEAEQQESGTKDLDFLQTSEPLTRQSLGAILFKALDNKANDKATLDACRRFSARFVRATIYFDLLFETGEGRRGNSKPLRARPTLRQLLKDAGLPLARRLK